LKVLEAESREVISVDAGPVQIGTIEDAFTEAGLSELAKHYFAAFRQEVQLECPALFVPVCMRETGMRGALNGTWKEAYG